MWKQIQAQKFIVQAFEVGMWRGASVCMSHLQQKIQTEKIDADTFGWRPSFSIK